MFLNQAQAGEPSLPPLWEFNDPSDNLLELAGQYNAIRGRVDLARPEHLQAAEAMITELLDETTQEFHVLGKPTAPYRAERALLAGEGNCMAHSEALAAVAASAGIFDVVTEWDGGHASNGVLTGNGGWKIDVFKLSAHQVKDVAGKVPTKTRLKAWKQALRDDVAAVLWKEDEDGVWKKEVCDCDDLGEVPLTPDTLEMKVVMPAAKAVAMFANIVAYESYIKLATADRLLWRLPRAERYIPAWSKTGTVYPGATYSELAGEDTDRLQ